MTTWHVRRMTSVGWQRLPMLHVAFQPLGSRAAVEAGESGR